MRHCLPGPRFSQAARFTLGPLRLHKLSRHSTAIGFGQNGGVTFSPQHQGARVRQDPENPSFLIHSPMALRELLAFLPIGGHESP